MSSACQEHSPQSLALAPQSPHHAAARGGGGSSDAAAAAAASLPPPHVPVPLSFAILLTEYLLLTAAGVEEER
jgi:hypothetical protein